MTDLRDRLRARADAQGLRLGPAQAAALDVVAALPGGPLAGAYLHGPAGRGKTWLLDALVAESPVPARRLHWSVLHTELDAEVGRRLGVRGALQDAVDAVLGDARVLCADELQVDDADDAGLVERLLRRCADRGVTVLLTSNTAPHDLLPGPRWASWVRGLLELLDRTYAVVGVDDGTDYRVLGAATRFATGRTGAEVPRGFRPAGLVSAGRTLPVAWHGEELWARFARLLSTPTGRADYLLLARTAGTVGLLDVPPLDEVDADTRQRFVVLVDVLHDTDTRLLLATSGEPDWSLLPPRTRSRLSLLR